MAPKTISILLKSRFYRENARLMAGITLFIWCWMLLYTFCFYRPTYTSDAWVMIKDSAITSGYVQAETYVAEKTTSSNAANPVLNTMGLLSSARIMEEVYAFLLKEYPNELKRIGVETKQDWQNYYKDGSAIIKAKNKSGTDLINLHVTWTDPLIAQRMASVVLDAFQHASQELNQEEQRNRRRYLEEEVNKLAGKLETVRATKSDFKRSNKTIDAERESLELTKLRMGFESRLNETLASAEGRQAELSRYQKMLGMTPEQALKASAVGMNPTISRLKNELYELSETDAHLSSNLTDRNPKVKEVRARMNQVKGDLRDELRQTLGRNASLGSLNDSVSDAPRARVVGDLVSAQADVIRLRQEANALRKRLSVIDGSIRQFPKVEEGLRNIEQTETSLSDSLDALRRKLTEARLKEAQTLSNVFIVDSARLPLKSNFPSKLQLALLSLLLGVVVGLVSVVLRYRFNLDDRFKVLWRQASRFLEPAAPATLRDPVVGAAATDAPDSFEKALDDIFSPRQLRQAANGESEAVAPEDLSPEALRQRLAMLKIDYKRGLARYEQKSKRLEQLAGSLELRGELLEDDDPRMQTILMRDRLMLQEKTEELQRSYQGLKKRESLIRRLESHLAEADRIEEIKRQIRQKYMRQRQENLIPFRAANQAS
ncbi:MAG: hypothetical protein IPK79_09230 [Vampirovibrionales bacterium]|nr:hypothetical protein [Vampirovibrionales bacterium]